jgi:hypothetical protein
LSNNAGIAFAALILGAAYIGGQYLSIRQAPHAEVIVGISATELFQIRSECRELGEKIIRENPPTLGNSQNFLSYYNESENRCYVEVQVSGDGGVTTGALLWDGQTNALLAMYHIDANGNSTAFIFEKLATTGKSSTLGDTMSFIQNKMNGMN